jgi:hypothetical protein
MFLRNAVIYLQVYMASHHHHRRENLKSHITEVYNDIVELTIFSYFELIKILQNVLKELFTAYKNVI